MVRIRTTVIAVVATALASVTLGAPPAGATPPNIPSAATAQSRLNSLTVAAESHASTYNRDLFPHWITITGSCNTREQVLKRDGSGVVVNSSCAPTSGSWRSPYDGATWTNPADVDIDHMVPLAEAWDSGAASWDAGRRQAYANDLDHPEALRAVSASSNRSKGDLDPGQWKPTRDAAWCEYANDWVTVKKAWDLTADQNEVDDLRVMLRTCGPQSPPPASPSSTATTARPTTTTATPPPTSGATVAITALDCQGEAVTVRNGATTPADLTGWSIHDEASTPHTYRFPAGYHLAPGASVTIRSGGPAGPGELAWTNQNVWNNDGDTATLVNAGGGIASAKGCS